jgi:hypothetical protein
VGPRGQSAHQPAPPLLALELPPKRLVLR